MLIRIIPETDSEKARFQEEEHSGVIEFFIMGNKRDEDKDAVDFHRWTGAYRYLIGSLYYFLQSLIEEQRLKQAVDRGEMGVPTPKKGILKNIKVDKPHFQVIEMPKNPPTENVPETPVETVDVNRAEMDAEPGDK